MCDAGQGCLPVILRDGVAKHSLGCLGRVMFLCGISGNSKYGVPCEKGELGQQGSTQQRLRHLAYLAVQMCTMAEGWEVEEQIY